MGSTGADCRIREATPHDLELVLHHRRAMFEDMGHTDVAALDAMVANSRPHLALGLADGSYRGFLAETAEGRVVAGGGIVEWLFLGHPRDPRLRRAEIVNVYTEAEFRSRGLARRLMQAMVEYCRREGFAWVTLNASDAGRALYEKLGFKPTNQMRLYLR